MHCCARALKKGSRSFSGLNLAGCSLSTRRTALCTRLRRIMPCVTVMKWMSKAPTTVKTRRTLEAISLMPIIGSTRIKVRVTIEHSNLTSYVCPRTEASPDWPFPPKPCNSSPMESTMSSMLPRSIMWLARELWIIAWLVRVSTHRGCSEGSFS